MTPAILPPSNRPVPPEGLSIGEAATATGLTVDAIRYYDRQGLLLDVTDRTSGGRRRFHDRDLRWLAGLVMLRETGMAIADIRVVAELSRGRNDTDGTERLITELERHRQRVLEDLERTKDHLRAIEDKLAAYREQLARRTH